MEQKKDQFLSFLFDPNKSISRTILPKLAKKYFDSTAQSRLFLPNIIIIINVTLPMQKEILSRQ